MKTSGLIRTLSAKRARIANVPCPNQPNTGKCHCGLRYEAVDDLRKDAIDRRLRGDRERHSLQGFRVHLTTLQRVLV
jgi:hypothetical protein